MVNGMVNALTNAPSRVVVNCPPFRGALTSCHPPQKNIRRTDAVRTRPHVCRLSNGENFGPLHRSHQATVTPLHQRQRVQSFDDVNEHLLPFNVYVFKGARAQVTKQQSTTDSA
jgi:hypothetical protein